MARKCTSVFVTLLLILLTFVSCNTSVPPRKNLTSADLAAQLAEGFPIEHGYDAYTAPVIELYFPKSLSRVQNSAVLYSVRPDDYTEIGVFLLNDVTDKEIVVREISDYLEDFRETYAPQAELYDPSQKEKLSGASLFSVGNYVIYSIMSEKEQRDLLKKARALLA